MATPDDSPGSPLSIRSTKPDQERTPDLRQVDSLTIEEGPRARKEVVHYEIRSRNTGEFKGHRIGFRTKYRREGLWQSDAAKSFTLESDDQIRGAVKFILAACEGSGREVIPSEAKPRPPEPTRLCLPFPRLVDPA